MGRQPAGPPGTDPDPAATVRAWVERSRQEQGLPLKVTDPRVLAEVAELLGVAQTRHTGRKRPGSKRL